VVDRRKTVVGLNNLGNTCFFNSVLQVQPKPHQLRAHPSNLLWIVHRPHSRRERCGTVQCLVSLDSVRDVYTLPQPKELPQKTQLQLGLRVCLMALKKYALVSRFAPFAGVSGGHDEAARVCGRGPSGRERASEMRDERFGGGSNSTTGRRSR
jgi:hypothetical protein